MVSLFSGLEELRELPSPRSSGLTVFVGNFADRFPIRFRVGIPAHMDLNSLWFEKRVRQGFFPKLGDPLQWNSEFRPFSLKGKGGAYADADGFFAGLFTTALAPDEILVEIEMPFMPPRSGWSFMEVAPRAGDYALMGVAVLVTFGENGKCKAAKLIYLNAGDSPVDAKEAAAMLAGESLNETLIESAAADARSAARAAASMRAV